MPLNVFCNLNITRYASCTASSMVSGMSCENGPVSQSRWLRNMLLVVCQSFLNGSSALSWALITGPNLVGAKENKRSSAFISSDSVCAVATASARASIFVAIASRSTISPTVLNSAMVPFLASMASVNAFRRSFTCFSKTLYSFSTVTLAFNNTRFTRDGHPNAATESVKSSSVMSCEYACVNSSRCVLTRICAFKTSISLGRSFM
mmetsp:Transcript_7053/g.26685  ORF Transcript_7053/g.26685 Transcript_7053/m.26685 type:complete len:206 (-) Transcript_7053:2785-3402(-)